MENLGVALREHEEESIMLQSIVSEQEKLVKKSLLVKAVKNVQDFSGDFRLSDELLKKLGALCGKVDYCQETTSRILGDRKSK